MPSTRIVGRNVRRNRIVVVRDAKFAKKIVKCEEKRNIVKRIRVHAYGRTTDRFVCTYISLGRRRTRSGDGRNERTTGEIREDNGKIIYASGTGRQR